MSAVVAVDCGGYDDGGGGDGDGGVIGGGLKFGKSFGVVWHVGGRGLT